MTDSELLANIALLLEGFDRGIFVRNTLGDNDPRWAIQTLPYLRAMAKLKIAVDEVKTA